MVLEWIRFGMSKKKAADIFEIVFIGAVPATMVILYVGAIPRDARPEAQLKKKKKTNEICVLSLFSQPYKTPCESKKI